MIEGATVGLDTDPAAFFRRLYPELHRWVARASGAPPADVEDLVQETLLQAWSARARFRGEASPLTWVVAIARNKIRDRWRRRDVAALAAVDVRPLPPGLEHEDVVRARVRKALDALPPDYAQLLRWRYLEGASVRSIAERLDESEKASESRLHRAREAFRDILIREDVDE